MYKSTFPMKNGLNIIYFLYAGPHKSFLLHYGLREGNFLKRILANLYCTKCNEINIFFEVYNSIFHLQDHTKGFGYIMGYASKRLEMNFQWCYMVFNTLKQSWKMFMHTVYPSVCTHSNCLKYSSNAFKFLHAVHIWYRMDSIENDMDMTNCSFTETHKRFPDTFRPIGGCEVFKIYCNLFILH